ncbi:MAG: acriflavin resistance protein [Limisphaerales bacterium]|nr:MAG: acriflavin resistance protein [Limisphaerales bacterium]
MPGVSLIKIYFQPGTNPDTAVSTIANLATANLRRLPPGTLPPVVLKFDASSLPVCLITLKGEGLTETELRDTGQYAVRNQVANVPGASVPQPFGGRYRQIMVYVDPLKLESHQLSVMDVVRAVNDSNLILPAGDVRIGPLNYNIYANSQLRDVADVSRLPLKTVGKSSVLVADVGEAKDASQIQNNIVRVDGQRSVYLPVLKQGGSTIAVVNGVKDAVGKLLDVPQQLVSKVVFDQSLFVKSAIKNLTLIGVIGLLLTGLMILMFFGSVRGTLAVFLSIPISVLAAFLALSLGDNSVNSMVLGGFALAFSRLINNSVVVIENIFRLLELGESPEAAAEKGGEQVAMPVLASSLATAVVFFPVIFLYGVSQFLFTALALAVVFSLFASYVVALTVVPLFCAKMLKRPAIRDAALASRNWGQRFNDNFKRGFTGLLNAYERLLNVALRLPRTTVLASLLLFAASLAIYPMVGVSYFPRTDPSQFLINVKSPTGTRVEITEKLIAQVEDIIRQEVAKEDLGVIVSNIGVQPGFSSIYTSNSGHHTASVQVSLNEGHKTGSYAYMDRVRRRITQELPQLSVYLQSGGLVDAVLNLGLPAPIDIQISGSNLEIAHLTALEIARKVRALQGVSDVLVPQDIDHPALKLEVIRARAAELGLTSKEVVQNVITAPELLRGPAQRQRLPAHRAIPGGLREKHGGLAVHPHALAEGAAHRAVGCDERVPQRLRADRGGPLPAPPRHQCLCRARRRGPRRGSQGCEPHPRGDGDSRRPDGDVARHGAWDELVVQKLRPRADSGGGAGVFDSGRAVPVVPRPAHHPAGRAVGVVRRARAARRHGHDAEHHVADGRGDGGGHRGGEQHPHC